MATYAHIHQTNGLFPEKLWLTGSPALTETEPLRINGTGF